MAQQLVDFADIISAVREELGIQSTDTSAITKIKRWVNIVYLNELVPRNRWYWLRGSTAITHKAYYGAGTASVTPDSTSVTLSVAPAVGLGSFVGYKFSTQAFDEIYEVTAHTAGSTAITLNTSYQGTLNATVGWKVWQDTYGLPTDARETYDVWHDHYREPLKGVGIQELRKIQQKGRKSEGYPVYYSTTDFYDPSTGDAETESDRYRQITFYPAAHNLPTTLNVSYIKEVTALNDDADEPVMPVEDRVSLLFGTLSKAWIGLNRNPEEAARNIALFENKVAQMSGRIEDSFDMPSIAPKSRYLSIRRSSRIGRRNFNGASAGGESAYAIPSYLEGTTINGANLTGNLTADAGITIDGRDVSVDGAALDTLSTAFANIDTANRVVITDGTPSLEESSITSTELTYLSNVQELQTDTLTDNTSSPTAIEQWSTGTYTSIQLMYEITRGSTNRAVGTINLTHDGTNAAIAENYADTASVGVTFTTDVSGGNLRLLYTTTSTGANATFKWKSNRFIV